MVGKSHRAQCFSTNIHIYAHTILTYLSFFVSSQLNQAPRGNDTMNSISDKIKSGARAFLLTEYRFVSVFVVAIVLLLFALYAANPLSDTTWLDGVRYSLSFFFGAILSALSGWGGMVAATDANVRTANAASKRGLNAALRVAFTGGSVAGFVVVGLGISGLSLVFYGLTLGYSDYNQTETLIFAANSLAGFGFGASSIALFSRVAGGIFTKAADVGTFRRTINDWLEGLNFEFFGHLFSLLTFSAYMSILR
jgi:Na+/H+-translocating membrane pyrophosphatase